MGLMWDMGWVHGNEGGVAESVGCILVGILFPPFPLVVVLVGGCFAVHPVVVLSLGLSALFFLRISCQRRGEATSGRQAGSEFTGS